jgi:hypothetical protein
LPCSYRGARVGTRVRTRVCARLYHGIPFHVEMKSYRKRRCR